MPQLKVWPQCIRCPMGLLPDTLNCGLRMRRECRKHFPHHRLQRKPLVSDPGMHHDTSFTHVQWCMLRSLTRSGGENVPGIPGACVIRNLMYLARGSLALKQLISCNLLRPIDTYIRQQNWPPSLQMLVSHRQNESPVSCFLIESLGTKPPQYFECGIYQNDGL